MMPPRKHDSIEGFLSPLLFKALADPKAVSNLSCLELFPFGPKARFGTSGLRGNCRKGLGLIQPLTESHVFRNLLAGPVRSSSA